jgi:tRNA-uridine 2-sulfurtransferase
MSRTVFVGLSGGVDSAVSAALLKEAGYNVTGVFIKIWQPEFLECTWRDDRLDAMRVAAYLQMPFREIDLSNEYKDEVVRQMIDAYQSGRTPNPDVLCNERIKFGHFLQYAIQEGADYVATGHYARVEHGEVSRLFRGKDASKDQSYFLYRLGNAELSRSFFPVGAMQKADVRKKADALGLPVARKHDSQGLCFVGSVSIPEFLSRYIELTEGDVRDQTGMVIGTHPGAALFTIGQRHGFSVASATGPLYVIATDVATNTVVVSPEKLDANIDEIYIDDLHWIREPETAEFLHVQTRYREAAVPATRTENRLIFDEPHIVSSGQSAVIYSGDECVGGGIIR